MIVGVHAGYSGVSEADLSSGTYASALVAGVRAALEVGRVDD